MEKLKMAIAKEVVVNVKENELNKIVEDFFKTADRKIYEVDYEKENGDKIEYVIFKLKKEVFLENVLDLIIEQIEKYIKIEETEKSKKFFEELKNKEKNELEKILNNGRSCYIENLKLGRSSESARIFFENRVDAYISEIIVFNFSPEDYLKEYFDYYKYMRNILVNSTENPLRTAIVAI